MQNIYEIFENYINSYDRNNEGVILKYNHSLRVSDYSKKIAESLDFLEDDIFLSEKCGLLHDIARFKQITEYKTFTDHKSFDHGDEGYAILKNNNYINEYEENSYNKKLIMATVKNHNKLQIESNLDDKIKLFCKIVRDADKIDILLTQSLYEISDNYNISDNIYKSFKNHEMVKNKDVLSEDDEILRQVAFIFDLEFKESFRIIKKSNILNKIFSYLKTKSKSNYLDKIEIIINDYMIEKLK